MYTTARVCGRCNAETDERSLSMSLDGAGMICQGCSIIARGAQARAGTRKAYVTGALLVGLFVLYLSVHDQEEA